MVSAYQTIQNSQFLNYHYFSKFRGIRPNIEKLTNWIQLYPPLESKKSWLLYKGDLWSRDLLVKSIYSQNNKSVWLSNMQDIFLEKLTRCAKVCGLFSFRLRTVPPFPAIDRVPSAVHDQWREKGDCWQSIFSLLCLSNADWLSRRTPTTWMTVICDHVIDTCLSIYRRDMTTFSGLTTSAYT